MIDSNDDFGGSLGSQLEWTAPDNTPVYALVRGYSDSQRGQFSIGILENGAATPGGGNGCIGCFYNNQCRDLANFPDTNPDSCARAGGVWSGAGDPCAGGIQLSDPTGSVTFTSGYADNGVCSWHVSCTGGRRSNPTFIFSTFDSKCRSDATAF